MSMTTLTKQSVQPLRGTLRIAKTLEGIAVQTASGEQQGFSKLTLGSPTVLPRHWVLGQGELT